jgi:ABC-type branched-subunit amino acid transport system ATPase component
LASILFLSAYSRLNRTRRSSKAIAALNLSDRAIILDMGEIVFDGSARDVIENKVLRQQYLAV